MDILLHLGAHRTATTSFQAFLWNNRAQLARNGITPWTPKRTRDGLLDGLVRHPLRVSAEDDRRGQRSVGRLRMEFARLEQASQRALVISEENLLGTMMNNFEDRRLYSHLIDRMARYAGAFDDHPLRIGLGIRDYEDFWTSSLCFALGRGHAAPDRDMLDQLVTQPRRWRSLVRDIAQVFPQAEIVVWAFERQAGRVQSMLEALTGEAPPRGLAHSDQWHNRSPNFAEIDEVLMIRGEALPAGQKDASTGRWMPFDEDQRAVLHAEYRRDLAWLAAGADGLATYIDGRQTPAPRTDGTRKLSIVPKGAVPIGGLTNGIQKGVV